MDRPYWYYNYVAFYLKIIIIVKTIFHMSCRCAYLDGPLNTGVNAWAVAIKAAKATVVDSFIVILFVLLLFLTRRNNSWLSYRFNLSWVLMLGELDATSRKKRMLLRLVWCAWCGDEWARNNFARIYIVSRRFSTYVIPLQSKRNKIKKDFQQFKLIVAYFASINQSKKQITSTTERRRETRSNNKKRNNLARGRKNDHH